MKYIFAMLLVLLVSPTGCEQETESQTTARYSDVGQYSMDVAGETCKNGVVYYVTFYANGIAMAPAFNTDSTVRLCK
ncbi:hypothetical protein D3C80_2108310 [compost metagenome]